MTLVLPLTAQAESAKAEKEISPLVYEPSLENQRNPNEYCAKCHKFDHPGSNVEQDMSVSGGQFHFGKFHGTHLSKTNPSTGKPITCVSCHGNITENHRRGAKDVMRFEGDIFSNKKPMYSAQEQNQVCFSCHQPDKLREKLWAHDVHAMKLPCASCHTLHPKTDAMEKIQPKERVKNDSLFTPKLCFRNGSINPNDGNISYIIGTSRFQRQAETYSLCNVTR